MSSVDCKGLFGCHCVCEKKNNNSLRVNFFSHAHNVSAIQFEPKPKPILVLPSSEQTLNILRWYLLFTVPLKYLKFEFSKGGGGGGGKY